MSTRMSSDEAIELARNPNTPLEILAKLASEYPHTWPFIEQNPSTYPELRRWIQDQMGANPPSDIRPAGAVEPSKKFTAVDVNQTTGRGPKRAKKNKKVPSSVWRIPILVGVLATVSIVIVSFVVRPVGTITTESLPSSQKSAWSTFVSPEGVDPTCLEVSLGDFDQDLALVLVQAKVDQAGCSSDDADVSTLSLINTFSGETVWKKNLSEELEWSITDRKSLVEIPGLNEVLIRFTEPQTQSSVIVPFNRLTGEVTDPAIAASGQLGPPHLPQLRIFAIPSDTKHVITMTPIDSETFRYSYFRARDLTAPEWTHDSSLAPVAGTPFVADKMILGASSSDIAEAIELRDGTLGTWEAPAGGAIITVDNRAIHLTQAGGEAISISALNGVDKVTVIDSAGGAVVASEITATGESTWSRESLRFIVLSPQGQTTVGQRSQYSALLSLGDGDSLMRVNVSDGQDAWGQPVVEKVENLHAGSSENTWLSIGPAEADALKSTLRSYDLGSGNLLFEAGINSSFSQVRQTQSSIIVTRTGSENLSECLESYGLRSGTPEGTVSCEESSNIQVRGGRWINLSTYESRFQLSSVANS